MSTTPKCPHCNACGIDCLAVEDMRMFLLVYCHKCGAIHGVVPNQPQPSAPPVGIKPAAEEKRPSPKIINIDPQSSSKRPMPGVAFPNRPPEADQAVTKPNPVFAENGS
ncbi:MAG: hypothetical protein KDJ65_05290 [Anaerolineae bacterium]|nr:hypothetical protein [Anaerolineae bacterium]